MFSTTLDEDGAGASVSRLADGSCCIDEDDLIPPEGSDSPFDELVVDLDVLAVMCG
jgi:hypothetical protein